MVPRSKNTNKNPEEKPVNICDICGAPHALLRTFTDDDVIVDALSGYTCQECLDIEEDYVEKLADKLNENQKLRDQLAERFQRIRQDGKAHFIGNHGLGVKHEKCEICGQGHSYLCIVEDHFEGHVEMLDEIAGWFCADCITTGIQRTHTNKVLHELMLFWKDTDEAKQESLNKSAFKQGNELGVQEAVYNRKAECMEKARLAYEGTPVKVVIKTGGEGDTCSFCGKTFGKDHKCGDMQNTRGDMNAF